MVSTSRPSPLLHMELFGCSKIVSIGENYYQLIINYYSRYTWTLFLSLKSDTSKAFKKLSKNYAKNENNLLVRPYVVSIACYVLNRILIRQILKKRPYRLYKKRKCNTSHFKVFGFKYEYWILVSKPNDHQIIGRKWIFRNKLNESKVIIVRLKARLVGKGYNQEEGIGCDETYNLVA
ncbi:putative mitochondrial protein, partial [Mucuna pruriens]